MLIYPHLNPVAFQLGSFNVHWYGLMYLLGFTAAWGVLAYRIKYSTFPRGFTYQELSDILFYAALGTIIGGRLGYMLFYAREDLYQDFFLLFQVWKGGMSFHGGLIGVIITLSCYGLHKKKYLGDIADFVIPAVPLGLAFGRLGNFINGELWGRVTDVPWGMVFPDGGPVPRHPSQLYEFFLEGVCLFLILWFFSLKPRPRWSVFGLFLICYGTFRIFIEFFREPDPQMGFIAFGWLTQGQLLSVPMVVIGIVMMTFAYTRPVVQKSNMR
jgi:phosphatidylglycerol:prolipoprotein diacylglycerol transferase